MTDPTAMMTTRDAATTLATRPATVVAWARCGKLAGSIKTDTGTWLVRRSEVERVLAERERAVERRLAKWTPMTERTSAHALGRPGDDGERQHP